MTRERLLAEALGWIDSLLLRGRALGLTPEQKRVLIALRAVLAVDDQLVAQVHARLQGRPRVEGE